MNSHFAGAVLIHGQFHWWHHWWISEICSGRIWIAFDELPSWAHFRNGLTAFHQVSQPFHAVIPPEVRN